MNDQYNQLQQNVKEMINVELRRLNNYITPESPVEVQVTSSPYSEVSSGINQCPATYKLTFRMKDGKYKFASLA